jgi:N-acetylmuramoyl-L-alanine amidase
MNNPERLVMDLADSTLGQVVKPAIAINDRIQGIRFSQFDKDTVRVVVDLKKSSSASLSLSDDQKSLIVLFSRSGEPIEEPSGDLPTLVEAARSKLIVIDAGHGGKDPGAIGYSNGQEVLYEKAVNLDVALRINGLLQEQGASIHMIRSDDTAVSLLERPAMANALNADLYISIHNNSSDSAAMRGFEVLYYNKSSETTYRIASSDFADLAQTALVRELGMAFKTPQERPTLAVLNKTVMPAIIIEGAFLSNSEDLAIIMTEAYRESYARAAATAIIQALNESVD